MIETLEKLVNINPPRNYKNIDSLNEVADYIKQRFEENGLITYFQEYIVSGKVYKNVIGVKNPEKDRTIIIGGHYDVHGNKPGADDNATAVAGLVETSKLLKNENIDFRLEFVAFTLEEPPYFGTKKMGSYVHAKSVRDENIVGMLNFEMIGYFSEKKKSQKFPILLKPFIEQKVLPTVGNFIAFVANKDSEYFLATLDIENRKKNIKYIETVLPNMVGSVTQSDHLNYWKFGIPAVMITDTAYHRNPHYHKKSDTIETLDLEKMREVIYLTVEIIKNIV